MVIQPSDFGDHPVDNIRLAANTVALDLGCKLDSRLHTMWLVVLPEEDREGFIALVWDELEKKP